MPPRLGNLDLKAWAESVPLIDGFRTDPWTLKNVRILQVLTEIEDDISDALLPRTMHPVIPSYAALMVASIGESPVGAFSIAEVRIGGRTGVRPRGFVLRSFVDNEAARKELAARWGFPTAPGEVMLEVRHDRVVGSATVGGQKALAIELLDRDFIGPGDVQYVASMHLARNREDQKLVLIQVDPEYVFSRAERGRPNIVTLDTGAFRAGDKLVLTNPISASFTTSEMTLPKLRYICNPELPAMQGTTKIAA